MKVKMSELNKNDKNIQRKTEKFKVRFLKMKKVFTAVFALFLPKLSNFIN